MATINVRQPDIGLVHRLERRAAADKRSPEGAVENDISAGRAAFPDLAVRLRCETEGSAQTPSEILFRDDRDRFASALAPTEHGGTG